MTIPSRPAPPPPKPVQTSSNRFGVQNASSSSASNKFANKKPAPPRPPPPKVTASVPLKKSGSQNFLTNLFGASKHNSKTNDKTSHTSAEQRIPPKLPAPPAHLTSRHQHHHSINEASGNVQLINFDESPTSSPPFIKKSNTGSDVSMDSFCSSNSSPNNLGCGSGTMSQAESGFEDDFSVSDFKVTSGMTSRSTTFSNDPFDCIEDFAAPAKPNLFQQANIRNVKPQIQPKPTSVGGANFYTCTSTVNPPPAIYDTLSNGKSLIKPSTVSMPTIIKPMSRGEVRKTAPVLSLIEQASDESFDDDLPSLPMPSIPPPPPPVIDDEDENEEKSSYAIALFNFESDVIEDLNLRANEKVYLLKQMNDEWMFGRNKRGCEGIFPISFVDIRVPLATSEIEPDSGTASRSASVSPAVENHRVKALYTFNAETDEDLTIKENEVVSVMYEINPEWLYGSNVRGDYGQFPANFIEYVPHNLPQMPK